MLANSPASPLLTFDSGTRFCFPSELGTKLNYAERKYSLKRGTHGMLVDKHSLSLGKPFGLIHSPYWGEERKKEVAQHDIVDGILNYLRSLSLSDEDLCKKFPECSLEDEVKNNVQGLEKQWGVKGKSLRNLLLRNPQVLGYNVDCKGD